MTTIAVSLDTSDARLPRRTRRRVDLRQIVTNIQMIRATSLRLGLPMPPAFEFSCGLYDQNTPHIEDFARFAITLGIKSVGFWNLGKWHHEQFPYHNTDVTEIDRVYPLDSLSPNELRPRLEAIQRAIGILSANNVSVDINGDFIEILANQCKAVDQSSSNSINAVNLPQGMTLHRTHFEAI